MSELKKAIAVGTVHYKDGDVQKIAQPGEAVSLSAKDHKDLTDLGAIREPRKGEDLSALDHDNNGGAGGSIDELDQKTVPELKEIAEKETVSLDGITKRDEILAAIRAARANDLLAN